MIPATLAHESVLSERICDREFAKLLKHTSGAARAISRGVAWLFLLSLLDMGVLHAQSLPRVVEVSAQPSCATCRISLTKWIDVGSVNDSLLLNLRTRFAVRGGALFAAPTSTPGRIAIFDTGGRLVRGLGRRGQGPAELASIVGYALDSKGLVVLQRSPARVSWIPFDSSEVVPLALVKQVDATSRIWSIGDLSIVASPYVTSANVGRAFAVRKTGELPHPFSALASTGPPIESSFFARQANGSPSTRGRFWLSRVNKYEIELWDTTGANLQRLIVKPSWFTEWATMPLLPWREPWPAQVVGIREAADGNLWVASWIAKRDWRAAPADSAVQESGVTNYVDTIIDVIDPVAGRLLATSRLPGIHVLSVNDLYFASYRIGRDGEYIWTLWRPTLQR